MVRHPDLEIEIEIEIVPLVSPSGRRPGDRVAAGKPQRRQGGAKRASITVTSGLYTNALPDLAFDAAEKAAAKVPRKKHLKVVG